MADFKNLNPFADEDDIENAVVQIVEPVTSENAEGKPATNTTVTNEGVTLDAIANRLINDRLYLTALELHIELLESGRELAKLRDFFSNPANFERTTSTRAGTQLGESSPPRMVRAPSIRSFESGSLDFARSSDDGERNENDRVAVLEFELRNAHETIRSLRAALTSAALNKSTAPTESTTQLTETSEAPSGVVTVDEPARPHERRALNFLVNEYLLQNDYKLTSVTFSEENEGQDFDDWDDVGINIAKPADLLKTYRNHRQATFDRRTDSRVCEVCHVGTSTVDDDITLSSTELQQQLEQRIVTLEDQIRLVETDNQALTLRLMLLQQQQQPDDRGSTPAVSPIKGLVGLEHESNEQEMLIEDSINNLPDDAYQTAVGDVEEVDSEVSALHLQVADTLPDSAETVMSNSTTVQQDDVDTSVSVRPYDSSLMVSTHRSTSAAFHRALVDSVFLLLPESRIYSEVLHIAELSDDAVAHVIPLLARCLPHIVPNVLLAARDELIPLIVCAAALHSDSNTRDQLLNVLFNLIKRPEAEQRRMILVGCVAFARHAGAARAESELLPQCWEQITHRYLERRLLVAEACGALAVHVPAELCSSLLLSMVQQMLDDNTEDVREAAVRSLGVLTGFVEDVDKYSLIESLLFNVVRDSSERVLNAVKQTFVPSLAVWSMELGRLETSLVNSLIVRIEKFVETSKSSTATTVSGVSLTDQKQFCLFIDIFRLLVPVLLASLLSTGPFTQDTCPSTPPAAPGMPVAPVTPLASVTSVTPVAPRVLPKPACELLDTALVLGGGDRLAALLTRYDTYTSEEWFHPWPVYTWLSSDFIPQLVSVVQLLDAADQVLVHTLSVLFRFVCKTFGNQFTSSVVRPQFDKLLQFPTTDVVEMSVMERATLVRCGAPVYAAGVLCTLQDVHRTALSQFLQQLISSAATHRCSLVGVKATVYELCAVDDMLPGLPDVLLSVLWDCVVSPSVLVRAAAASVFEPAVRAGGVSEALIASRIVPALVTLAGDSNADVRAATVTALGATIECVSSRSVLDKVYMQLQSLMDDPAYRDEHSLRVALIRTLGRAGPAAEPRFRDDFVLPRLTALAVQNSSCTEITSRRSDIALALFDAYSAVSCCFVGDQLVSEVLLPGLKCLHRDLLQMVPDYANVVASMIREFEDRVDSGSGGPGRPAATAAGSATNGNTNQVPAASPGSTAPSEGIKLKMFSHIKDVKDRATHSNLSKIFNASKK